MKPTVLVIEAICFDRERVIVQAPFFHDLRKVTESKAVIAIVNQMIEEHHIYPAKAKVLLILGDYKPNRKWKGDWVEVDYSAWAESFETAQEGDVVCSST
jgi:hypothetical protein